MQKQSFNRSLSILCLALVIAILFPVILLAGGNPDTEEIIGIEWKWRQTRYNNDTNAVPNNPDHYTIRFNGDGTVNIRADCNRGGGTYSLEGQTIKIGITHTTRAMCPPDSLEQTFIKDLSAASIYFFRNGDLYLDLKYDSGTMKLLR